VHFVVNEKPHAVFTRKNADLFIDRKITLLEALTGANFEITHLDGRKLFISTKPGEVIKPPKEVDAEWEVLEDTDCPECDDVAKCQFQGQGIDKLKEVCEQKGFTAFCIDKSSSMAHFMNDSRREIIAGKRSTKAAKGHTLYVVPDDAVAAVGRMRKAVKEEGLPTFKNQMQKGNLFINITIDFPESIAEDAAKQLKAILPGPKKPVKETEEHEVHYLVDMDPKASEKAAAHAYEEDDDDERRGPGGGQQVQCAQQ